jgi:hypothetical protein
LLYFLANLIPAILALADLAPQASAFGTKFFPISTWPFSVLLRRKSITWLARLNFSSLSYEKIPALILDYYFAPQALGKA